MLTDEPTLVDVVARWVLMAIGFAGASPLVIAPLWIFWDRIRPFLIPQAEIDRVAEEWFARYGEDAIKRLAIDADRAVRRGDDAEAGTLFRIMKAIAKIESSQVN